MFWRREGDDRDFFRAVSLLNVKLSPASANLPAANKVFHVKRGHTSVMQTELSQIASVNGPLG